MTIKNETIKKLTARELNDLGCCNIGIIPVNGTPKRRLKDFNTKVVDGVIIYYNSGLHTECHLIPTADGAHAFRVFDKRSCEYSEHVLPLTALRFIKK
jgi:hypothetical protein